MSTDIIERLQAANLVADAEDAPPFSETVRRIAELDSPPPRRRRVPRRPRARRAWRLALPIALAAGITVAVAVVPDAGAPNIVAEARAAIAPGADIVHVVTRLQIPERDRRPGGWNGEQERWSSTEPYRTRTVSPAKTPDGERGSVQTVFDGATARVRRSWDDADIVDRLSPEQQRTDAEARRKAEAAPYPQAVAFTEDPTRDLRTMLANGSLRPAGRTTIDGRPVERLVAHLPRRVVRADRGEFVDLAVDFDYFVDASTFAPVRITTTTTLDTGEKNATTTDIVTYERLPNTPENQRLLELPPG